MTPRARVTLPESDQAQSALMGTTAEAASAAWERQAAAGVPVATYGMTSVGGAPRGGYWLPLIGR